MFNLFKSKQEKLFEEIGSIIFMWYEAHIEYTAQHNGNDKMILVPAFNYSPTSNCLIIFLLGGINYLGIHNNLDETKIKELSARILQPLKFDTFEVYYLLSRKDEILKNKKGLGAKTYSLGSKNIIEFINDPKNTDFNCLFSLIKKWTTSTYEEFCSKLSEIK